MLSPRSAAGMRRAECRSGYASAVPYVEYYLRYNRIKFPPNSDDLVFTPEMLDVLPPQASLRHQPGEPLRARMAESVSGMPPRSWAASVAGPSGAGSAG